MMNRSIYFDYIEGRLTSLATSIEVRGKLNLLNLHLHSENFYLNFFNQLFGLSLINMNSVSHNTEAIDLIDSKNKIVIQVSATATKQKIESALSKDLSIYPGYSFKFISISKDASDLRDKTYPNPHQLIFDPLVDIYDIQRILKLIMPLPITDLRPIYDFIKSELGSEPDPVKLETNLAAIINIIASEDLSQPATDFQINVFEVERKIDFNNLKLASSVIADYSLYTNLVDTIYSEFNLQGQNKSLSVLHAIKLLYLKHKLTLSDDILFFNILESVSDLVRSSDNYIPICVEELDLCVNILVVDAFIRCKIFENPMNYSYVVA